MAHWLNVHIDESGIKSLSEGFSLVAVVFHEYRNDISTSVERYESRLKTAGIERHRP